MPREVQRLPLGAFFGTLHKIVTMYKFLVALFVLGLVFAVQFTWVNVSVAFLGVLNTLSENTQLLAHSVIFCPVFEELLNRYLPLEIARRYFPKAVVPIAVGSSIIFGLCHDNPFPANLFIQGFLGLTFSWVYWKFGLKYSILSHALWNLACFLNVI